MTRDNQLRLLPTNMRLLWPVFRVIQRSGSPEKVAHTSIYLASAPEAANMTGQYFESSTRPKNLSAEIIDQVNQEKTWEVGTSLVCVALTATPLEFEPVI